MSYPHLPSTDLFLKIGIGLGLILIFAVSMYWFVSVHENVHISVAERNNCETSDVQLLPSTSQDLGSFSLALAGVNYSCPSHSVFEKVKVQQQTVDTVGYQLFPLYMILVLILLLQLVKIGF